MESLQYQSQISNQDKKLTDYVLEIEKLKMQLEHEKQSVHQLISWKVNTARKEKILDEHILKFHSVDTKSIRPLLEKIAISQNKLAVLAKELEPLEEEHEKSILAPMKSSERIRKMITTSKKDSKEMIEKSKPRPETAPTLTSDMNSSQVRQQNIHLKSQNELLKKQIANLEEAQVEMDPAYKGIIEDFSRFKNRFSQNRTPQHRSVTITKPSTGGKTPLDSGRKVVFK